MGISMLCGESPPDVHLIFTPKGTIYSRRSVDSYSAFKSRSAKTYKVELEDDNFKIFTAENDRKAQETALIIAKDFGSDFCRVSVYEEET